VNFLGRTKNIPWGGFCYPEITLWAVVCFGDRVLVLRLQSEGWGKIVSESVEIDLLKELAIQVGIGLQQAELAERK
jgi:GAF domain-containing protein